MKKAIEQHWKDFHDQQAKKAANTEFGEYTIIGTINGIVSEENMQPAEKVRQIQYLLKAFDKARQAGI